MPLVSERFIDNMEWVKECEQIYDYVCLFSEYLCI
jgi:hypothetical protein